MSQHFLIADIGATQARFQLASAEALVGDAVRLTTLDHDDAQALLAEAVRALDGGDLDGAVLAVAGPLAGDGSITVTNTGHRFVRESCSAQLGCATHVVNDFYAQAHGVPHFASLAPIGAGTAQADAVKVMLGAGTGLGAATLVPLADRGFRVLASEAGHATLAIGSHLEAELWAMLAQRHEHVSWETVLSGPGLENLYAAMCSVWGSPQAPRRAEEIAAAGVDMSDPVCHQTLEAFCGLLGAAAASMAMTVCATGGVYLGGGVVRGIADFLVSSPLRRRFDECGKLAEFVREIPIWVVMDATPGLVGAHRCLMSRLEA